MTHKCTLLHCVYTLYSVCILYTLDTYHLAIISHKCKLQTPFFQFKRDKNMTISYSHFPYQCKKKHQVKKIKPFKCDEYEIYSQEYISTKVLRGLSQLRELENLLLFILGIQNLNRLFKHCHWLIPLLLSLISSFLFIMVHHTSGSMYPIVYNCFSVQSFFYFLAKLSKGLPRLSLGSLNVSL